VTAIGTPSVVPRPTELPRSLLPWPLTGWRASQDLAHRLASEPPACASAQRTESSLASDAPGGLPCGSSRGATLDASDRLLPSHVIERAPAPRRFSMRHALARLRGRGDRLLHVQGDSLRWVARPPGGVVAVGVVFPSRRVQTEPLTLLSPPPGGDVARANVHLFEGRQEDPPRARVNGARCRSLLECLPSSKDRCPATPFRAPGSGLRLHRDLAAAIQAIDAVSPSPTLAGLREPGSRPRTPLPPEERFSEPWRSLPTSATVFRRAGTPDERSTLAREWGFRPATRRHQPMPVASVS